jgi:hypothetical protein
VERNINQLKHVKQSGLIFVRPEPALQVILGAKNFHCNDRFFSLQSQKIFIAFAENFHCNAGFTFSQPHFYGVK